MALDTAIVSDIAGLEALETPWWRLFDTCPEATPFQSPAWLIAWWRAFHPGDLRTIAVRDGDRLVGLAPFYIERAIAGGRLLAMGIGISDYLDVLVAPDWRGAALSAIAAAIEMLPGWQEWELTDMAPFAAGRDLPHLSSCATEEGPAAASHVLALADDPAALLPGGKASKLRTAEHRATRDGGYTIRRADAGSLDPLLTRLIDLHQKRWMMRGETGVFADPRVERCHREALPQLCKRGMLRLYGLERKGAVSAVQLGFLHRRRASFYVGGFDPNDAQISPGTLLTAHTIKEAQSEGCHWFDFLKGDEAHKLGWGAKRQEAFRRVWRRQGEEAAREAVRLGLKLQEDGPAKLRLWDASLFHFVRQ
jgi:CelD/BcsL family acetyltransferase involved in cellulose biosynthesis